MSGSNVIPFVKKGEGPENPIAKTVSLTIYLDSEAQVIEAYASGFGESDDDLVDLSSALYDLAWMVNDPLRDSRDHWHPREVVWLARITSEGVHTTWGTPWKRAIETRWLIRQLWRIARNVLALYWAEHVQSGPIWQRLRNIFRLMPLWR